MPDAAHAVVLLVSPKTPSAVGGGPDEQRYPLRTAPAVRPDPGCQPITTRRAQSDGLDGTVIEGEVVTGVAEDGQV